MRRILIPIAILAAFGLGAVSGLFDGGGPPADGRDPGAPPAAAVAEPEVWTCAMHPQIRLPKPGQCPICFMDLIPADSGSDSDLGPRTLELSAGAAALAQIQTSEVKRQVAEARIRLLGKIDYDETRTREIAAWFPGRIDTLLVAFTGTTVAAGEQVASVYSPELFAAQSELLSALRAADLLQGSSDPAMRRTADRTVQSARKRLELLGLNPEQVAAIEQRGAPATHLRITAPIGGVVVHRNAAAGMYLDTGTPLFTVADLSSVWLNLRAYESDLPWLALDQTVEFTVDALPGRRFSGRIVFIDPVLDQGSRTAMVRADVPNGDGLLKPGMFVTATLVVPLGAGGDPDGGRELPLVIPATAPLLTGKRAVVYVQVPDRPSPTFAGREVVLGPRAGDQYVVVSGLQEGEMVVTRGNFKIDSALQIQAKPSMMNPGDGAGAPAAAAGPAAAAAMPAMGVPDAFADQLGVVLGVYDAVQAALAADDDAKAAGAALEAQAALAAVDPTLLEGPARQSWLADAPGLRSGFEAVASARDIAGRRRALLPLSEALWSVLQRYGYRGDRPVRLFTCPMADDNRGGRWLQLEPGTLNPYFGAAMLRCGSQTDSLAVLPAPGQRSGS